MADDNVTSIGIKYKQPVDDKGLLKIVHSKCMHGPFLVDEKQETVECQKCGDRLNAIWVLRKLASKEYMWHEFHTRYEEEMKRLDEKRRTKCTHCGEFTRLK